MKVSLFNGNKDRLSTMDNVQEIIKQIPNISFYELDNWGHSGYFWAKDKSQFLKYLNESFNI